MRPLLFGFHGRLNRARYWSAVVCAVLADLVLLAGAWLGFVWVLFTFMGMAGGYAMANTVMPDSDEMTIGVIVAFAAFPVLALLLQVPVIWILLAVSVKRLHDRGRSGGWLLLNLLPVIGQLWLFVECGCRRGVPGPNAYGADPLGGAMA